MFALAHRYILSAAFLALVSPSSLAATPPIPLASVPYFLDQADWAVLLGAGIEYEVDYDGSKDYGTEFDPVFAAQWQRGSTLWFWEGNEIGARWLDSRSLLQVGLRHEEGRQEDDGDALRGLGDVDSEWMAVGETRYALAPNWAWYAAARLMLGPSSRGSLAVAALGKAFKLPAGWKLDALLFSTFSTPAFKDADFGVTAEQSLRPGLPQYRSSGGYRSTGLQFALQLDLNERWVLLAETGIERYANSLKDSPIIRNGRQQEAELGLGLAWRFQ